MIGDWISGGSDPGGVCEQQGVDDGRNLTHYRGLAGVDSERWQQLVDQRIYNPLRDTQLSGPPAAFYDRALKYYGARDRFVTLGDYATLDAALRITNQNR